MSKKGNGEGTIYYSESLKRWVGQFVQYRKSDGSLKRKSLYGKTRKEVRDKMTIAMAEVQTNSYIENSNVSLVEIMEERLENQLALNQIIESTYIRTKANIQIIKDNMQISEMRIQDITINDINKSLKTVTNYSNSVLKKLCGLLSSAYDIAVVNKIVNSNPFRIAGAIIRPKSDKETKKVDALTIEEQKAFIAQLENYYEPYKTIFYIATYSGMRIGEILALTAEDIDYKNRVIHVKRTITRDKEDNIIIGKTTKTYSGQRDIPIINELFKVLKDRPILLNQKELLFREKDHPISPNVVNAHFKRICKNAEIRVIKVPTNSHGRKIMMNSSKVNTHMLRHTFATRCIESGMQAVVLSKILGHKEIQTTLDTYTSVFEKFKNDEVEKINALMSELH